LASNSIFISYKHGDPSTKIAKAFCNHLLAVSDALGMQIYMDDKDNLGGDLWSDNVDKALKECTHFIVLLNTAYWLSEECRRELRVALGRFEQSKTPRLLFVKAEEIRPDLFSFNKDRQTGELTSDDPQVNKVGDIHFLGPFDKNTQLVRLAWENKGKLSDQFAQLLNRLERTLKPAAS
jgi:hypothetical protein